MADTNFTPQQIEEFLQEFFDVVGARQYIGARYVPIFGRAGEDTVEWDDGAPYEPLTVVMHEGISYVSRRYVPTGIEITDTDYWVETYRFNAQVEQYRQEVLGFTDRIDGAYDAVDALRDEVADEYVPFPDPDHYPKYGTANQVLSTLTNGETRWVDPVIPDSETVGIYVDAWLNDHPEATTTVQDGAITTPKLADNSVTDAKLADILSFCRVYKTLVISGTGGNYATTLPDLDSALDNTIYRILQTDTSANQAAHLPTGLITYSPYYLITITALNDGTPPNKYQRLIAVDSPNHSYQNNVHYWERMYRNSNNTWTSWTETDISKVPGDNTVTTAKIANGAVTDSKIADALTFCRVYKASVTSGTGGNYASTLPDLNSASDNTIYKIITLDNSANQAGHLPTGLIPYSPYYLMTITMLSDGTPPNKYQRLIAIDSLNHSFQDNVHYWERTYRNSVNSWSEWVETDIHANGGLEIVVGSGQQYTSILRGVMAALEVPHSHVLVKAGTYDIAQEILDYYGAGFLSQNDVTYRGIPLGNYITVEFESGAVAELDLSGASYSDAARSMVSIFNSGDSNPEYNDTGFTLINATLIGTDCRYCVHDEHGGVLDNYSNHYINCRMHKICNTQYSAEGYGRSNGYALGGGLGEHGYITIDGCSFSRTINSGQTSDVDYPIFYHTSFYSQTQNALSEIYVRDCYIDTTIRFNTIGDDAMSQMFVSGCSCGSAPTIDGNLTSGELIAWNNEIRTP